MNANGCKDQLQRLAASLVEVEQRLHGLPEKASERGKTAVPNPLGFEHELASRYAKESGAFEGGVIGAEFDVRRARERLEEIIAEFFGSEEMSETASAIGAICRPAPRDLLNAWRNAKGV